MTLWAGAWTWAEFITITPEKNITRWERQGTVDDRAAYEKAWDRLQTARRLNPANADYDLALGRLALLGRKSSVVSPESSQKGGGARRSQSPATNEGSSPARLHLQHALAKRPSSGLAWTYLAKTVADDPAESELFIKALTRSATLEPYEELNQQQLIPLALKHWNRLPPPLQETMQNIIEHAKRYQPKAFKKGFEAVKS